MMTSTLKKLRILTAGTCPEMLCFLEELGCEVSPFRYPQGALNEFLSHPEDYDMVVCETQVQSSKGRDLLKFFRSVRKDIATGLTDGFRFCTLEL